MYGLIQKPVQDCQVRFMLLPKGKECGGVVERELGDAQWELVRPWLPAPGHRGLPEPDDLSTVYGVLLVLRAGCR